jgi:hypothetical protein
MFRDSLPAALLLLALSGIQPAEAQQWIEYQPDGAGYRIAFPGKPTEETREVNTNIGRIRMRTCALGVGNAMFMTISSIYPPQVSMGDPQKNLDGARNGSVRNVNGTLRTEQALNFGDAPARHLVIDIPKDNQAADTLVVLDGHKLVQAIYVGPRGTEETPEVRRFLTSFALVH